MALKRKNWDLESKKTTASEQGDCKEKQIHHYVNGGFEAQVEHILKLQEVVTQYVS